MSSSYLTAVMEPSLRLLKLLECEQELRTRQTQQLSLSHLIESLSLLVVTLAGRGIHCSYLGREALFLPFTTGPLCKCLGLPLDARARVRGNASAGLGGIGKQRKAANKTLPSADIGDDYDTRVWEKGDQYFAKRKESRRRNRPCMRSFQGQHPSYAPAK